MEIVAVLDSDLVAKDDLGSLSLTERPDVARTGVRGLLARTGVKLGPSKVERGQLATADRLRRDEETIRQATWSRAVGILVANRKGGVGKTPTAVIVGGLLASIRGGSVAIMEVSDDPGTLTFRTEGAPTRGMGELLNDADTISSAGQLAGYTAPQTSFASVIGTIRARPQLTGKDVRRVTQVLDQHYQIRVMDSGNQPSSSAFEGAVQTADALVIPVLNSADVVLEAVALLEQLRASGNKGRALADGATVIRLTDGRPENPQLIEHLTRLIYDQNVANAFTIPYDAHIAERGPITIAKLNPATRAAFTAATAGIIRNLQDRPLDRNQ
jgi:MinD-like ATPase involved in chromosome partitioning or flagellar assembly